MKILVIYTYPHHNSFNGAILSNLLKNIDRKENEVKLIDLYAEKFDPILRFDDKKHRRRDLQFDEEMQEYRDLLVWSNHIIFIFPIWWGSMPAVLKGFIERVFSTGFIYKFNGLVPESLQLKRKTAAIITTHDTPKLYVKFFQQDYGKLLEKQVLKLMAGIKTTYFLQMSYLRGASVKKRENF